MKTTLKIKRKGLAWCRKVLGLQLFPFFISIFFLHAPAPAQTALSAENRIESEFKLAVPEGQADEVWDFLQADFSTEMLQKQNPRMSSSTETESFVDQYFDDGKETLLSQKAGARHRQRFLGDSLLKTLVQLKLPDVDTSGVARREVKFDLYEAIKKGDRMAMHPFWRLIKPKDRADVNLYLSQLGTRGDDLQPVLKLKQLRRRVYISEDDQAFMTITLDRVSYAHFPYPHFTEMELELNEIRYTEGDLTERTRLEKFNTEVKQKIMERFPGLRQDQTPKYNKMKVVVNDSWSAKVAGNLAYLVLGGLALTAVFLFAKTEIF